MRGWSSRLRCRACDTVPYAVSHDVSMPSLVDHGSRAGVRGRGDLHARGWVEADDKASSAIGAL